MSFAVTTMEMCSSLKQTKLPLRFCIGSRIIADIHLLKIKSSPNIDLMPFSDFFLSCFLISSKYTKLQVQKNVKSVTGGGRRWRRGSSVEDINGGVKDIKAKK